MHSSSATPEGRMYMSNLYVKRNASMIIKVNGSELEVTDRGNVYLGMRERGQTFKNLEDLNEAATAALENIRFQAEQLIRQAEGLLTSF